MTPRTPRSPFRPRLLLAALFPLAAACNGGHPAEAKQPAAPSTPEAGVTAEAEPAAHVETTLPTSTLPTGSLPSVLDPEPVAPEPEETVPEPMLTEVDGLSLSRLVVARGVQNREPVEAGHSFESREEPIYAFLDAKNESLDDRTLVITFEGPGGLVTGDVMLDVPAESPRYRTWARSSYVQRPGTWHAVVRTLEGDFVGELAFEIQD